MSTIPTLAITTQAGLSLHWSERLHTALCRYPDRPCDCGLDDLIADVEDQARALEYDRLWAAGWRPPAESLT